MKGRKIKSGRTFTSKGGMYMKRIYYIFFVLTMCFLSACSVREKSRIVRLRRAIVLLFGKFQSIGEIEDGMLWKMQ